MITEKPISAEESMLLADISARAKTLGLDKAKVLYCLGLCHTRGCPLDLKRLAAANSFNFVHDVLGIMKSLDLRSGKLLDCFRPRFAAGQPVAISGNPAKPARKAGKPKLARLTPNQRSLLQDMAAGWRLYGVAHRGGLYLLEHPQRERSKSVRRSVVAGLRTKGVIYARPGSGLARQWRAKAAYLKENRE